MGRVLAIDYGTKRTGLAVTDTLQIIASALDTVPSHTLITYLQHYTAQEPVEAFVIGMPVQTNGELSENARFVQTAIKHLKKAFPAITIYEVDERFTSKMAQQAIIASGINKKQRQVKGTVDKISAVIILQWWMEYKKPV